MLELLRKTSKSRCNTHYRSLINKEAVNLSYPTRIFQDRFIKYQKPKMQQFCLILLQIAKKNNYFLPATYPGAQEAFPGRLTS